MSYRSLTVTVLCLAVLATLVLVTGCPPKQPEQTIVTEPPSEPETAPAEQPTTEEPAAKVAEFEWTDTPTVEDIPAGPVTGMLDGKPFVPQTVRVEKNDDGSFDLQLSSKALEDPNDSAALISGDDGWEFTFTMEEGTTGILQWAVGDDKTYGKEHVYYWYDRGDEGPMSVNYPWGAAMEITEWTVQEPVEGSDVVGTIKGRVALVMQDDAKSWVAGEFEAPVYVW